MTNFKETSIPVSFAIALFAAFFSLFILCGVFVAYGIYMDIKQTRIEESEYKRTQESYPMIDRRRAK